MVKAGRIMFICEDMNDSGKLLDISEMYNCVHRYFKSGKEFFVFGLHADEYPVISIHAVQTAVFARELTRKKDKGIFLDDMLYAVNFKKCGSFYQKKKRTSYPVGFVENKFRIVGIIIAYRTYFHCIPPFCF